MNLYKFGRQWQPDYRYGSVRPNTGATQTRTSRHQGTLGSRSFPLEEYFILRKMPIGLTCAVMMSEVNVTLGF